MTDETRRFEKTVAIKAVDEDDRTATGAVLVPNEVDHQRDFLRKEGVENLYNDDPEDGVMHAAFPEDAAELVENEVVSEPTEIDGEEYPAGTWIATRKYHDDDLWSLVEDGILTGFSIGGEVTDVTAHAAADVPDDVSFPEDVPEGPAAEIHDGRVEEVSDVDVPAVPRAVYQSVKSLGKSVVDEVDGVEEFITVMAERGHSESDARELWRFLSEHTETETKDAMSTESDTDDEQTPEAKEADAAETEDIEVADDETVGKRLKRLLFGPADDGGNSPEDPDGAEAATKEGRTLSQTNRRAVMASIDAQLDLLDNAGVDHGLQRFTDRDDYSFDLSEYGKAAPAAVEDTDKDASGGEKPGSDMSNDDTEKSDPPEWAASLTEKVEQIDKRVSEMEDEDDEAEKSLEDAPEWAKDLASTVEDLDERVDKVSKATADTQQVAGGEETADTTEKDSTEQAKKQIFLPSNAQEEV